MSENFGLKSNPEIRIGFVKKVYGILTAQLLFTTLFVFAACLPNINPEKAEQLTALKAFNQALMNPILLGLMVVGLISSMCAIVCCKMDKKVPVNYILLGVFTFC